MSDEHKPREDWSVDEILEHRKTGKRPQVDDDDQEAEDRNEMSAEEHLERIQTNRRNP